MSASSRRVPLNQRGPSATCRARTASEAALSESNCCCLRTKVPPIAPVMHCGFPSPIPRSNAGSQRSERCVTRCVSDHNDTVDPTAQRFWEFAVPSLVTDVTHGAIEVHEVSSGRRKPLLPCGEAVHGEPFRTLGSGCRPDDPERPERHWVRWRGLLTYGVTCLSTSSTRCVDVPLRR